MQIMPSVGGKSPAQKVEVITMKRRELFVFRTRDIQRTTSVSLCKYTHDYDSNVEYVVVVYEYTQGRIREMDFDNISAAKKRFLFEVENAAIFAEE